MKKILILLLGLHIGQLLAQPGCAIRIKRPGPAHYICYDGRMLRTTNTGYYWNAKRGCFKSREPCCYYQASFYGYYRNPYRMDLAMDECRENYPYHWGEMQTH